MGTRTTCSLSLAPWPQKRGLEATDCRAAHHRGRRARSSEPEKGAKSRRLSQSSAATAPANPSYMYHEGLRWGSDASKLGCIPPLRDAQPHAFRVPHGLCIETSPTVTL